MTGLLASCSGGVSTDMTAQGDQAVLDQLTAAGSNLSKPTDMVFYLYIPSHKDALASVADLRKRGFRSQTHSPLGKLTDGTMENRWSVISHVTAVPTLAMIRKAAAAMTLLARRYGGEYDGWEAAVEK